MALGLIVLINSIVKRDYHMDRSNYKKILLLLVFFTVTYLSLSAQIVIGSSKEPKAGAIIELDNDSKSSTKGGLLIARVVLSDLEKIPFIDQSLSSEELKKKNALHIGHLVYNVGSVVNIPKGLYSWNGAKWELLLSGDITTAGPWYKVHEPEILAIENNENIYINAKIVVGSDAVATFDEGDQASLTIKGSDASFNEATFGTGANPTLVDQNIAAGKYALIKNKSGKNNVALGYEALNQNTQGSSNIAVGTHALKSLTSGIQNTSVGHNSGSNITTGSNNLTIGANTQVANPAGNNQLNIGNALLGKVGSIAIGKTEAANGVALDVNKSILIESIAESTEGEVLVIDKEGNVGRSGVTPMMYVYVNSTDEQNISTDPKFTENSHNNFVLFKWSEGDIPFDNGVIKLNSDGVTFTVLNEFVAQLSGYVNYMPNSVYSRTYSYARDDASSLLNVGFQIKKTIPDNDDEVLSDGWVTISMTRGVWTQAERDKSVQTIVVPQVIQTLRKGDQIRMVLNWPNSASTASTHYGLEHGKSASDPSKIIKKDGLMYSKGFRIVSM